jgi:tetratricopeptide (TPR) repeat protein
MCGIIRANPYGKAMTHTEQGIELLQKYEPRKAMAPLGKALKKERTYGTLINYGAAERGCGLLHEAKEKFYEALALDQSRPEAWNELAQVYTDLGEFENAPGLFQRALQCIEKMDVPVHSAGEPLLGFAYSMMRLGQFEYAWPVWEAARINRSWAPFVNLPPWRGEPGARLLVLVEGGFGDGFNFLRWLPLVDAREATVLVWDSMFEFTKHVFKNSPAEIFPLSHTFQYDELAKFTHSTGYLSLMSCGGSHGFKKWQEIPPPLDWSPRGRTIAPPNDWIGFCWKAEENGVMRKIRSLDPVTANRVGRSLAHSCHTVISLSPQGKGLSKNDPATIPAGVHEYPHSMDSWEETALTILKCKLIVTVDTAIAHLAGSLGVPTLILLPRRSDWKWGVSGDATSFYGSNVKLYRELNPVGWSQEEIRKAVERM